MEVPTFVWLFFKLITPFIDHNTREKLKFNENLREYVPPEQLYELFGGDCEFEYDHKTFWPAYLQLASERREKYFARWKAAGGGIGQSEWDLRADGTESEESATDTVRNRTLDRQLHNPRIRGKRMRLLFKSNLYIYAYSRDALRQHGLLILIMFSSTFIVEYPLH